MKRIGTFFACLLFNLLFNLEWSIPAWILLAMHIFFGWKIIWFVIALAIWIVSIILWMDIIGWASSCSSSHKPKENKNPYSVGQINQDRKKDNN